MDRAALYRTIWRWHFYAGLFVIPFILLLATTGAIYLFKPQIDAWEEQAWRGPAPIAGSAAISPDDQVAAATAALPGAAVRSYRLPRAPGEPAVVTVGDAHGGARQIFVSPTGQVTAIVDPDHRWSAWISRLHGSLLVGTLGGYLVETAASWAIVLILTGLFLWWPRGRGMAGVLWPRLRGGVRTALRDLHAVTGFWVSGLALLLLLSGLPWTDGWAAGFRLLRTEMGWTDHAPQDWKGGGNHGASHGGHGDPAPPSAMTAHARRMAGSVRYSHVAALARAEALPFPVIIQPPFAASRFGPPNGNVWKLTSETQNRPLIRTILYDPVTAAEVGRTGFADRHVIDRAINYGIAWHEGQLLGWFNQLVGVLTAAALILLAVSGATLWWRRRPAGSFGGPPPLPAGKARGFALLLLLPALLLPMLALSLLLVAAIDRAAALLLRSNGAARG